MRLEEKGHVRERAERDERDRSVGGFDLCREEVLCVLGDGFGARRREVDAVEPGLAVGIGCDDELADEGSVRAGGDWNIRPARELEDAECVRRRLVERLVSGHRGHAEDVELRAAEREEERKRVVLARVAVDEDRDHARRQSRSAKSRFSGFRSGSVP